MVYLKKMRQYTTTAYLTGMNNFLYPVDILINYHILIVLYLTIPY